MTSAANAFMGATYTILKFCFWMTPWLMLASTSRSTASMAMLVFPAPVGAQTNRFSLLRKAAGKMRLWMRFRVLQGHSSKLQTWVLRHLQDAAGKKGSGEKGLCTSLSQLPRCISIHIVCGL